jgi:hypothetical protein
MNIVLQCMSRTLIWFSEDELVGVCNAMNAVCNGIAIDDSEFQTRLGVSRDYLLELLGKINAGATHPVLRANDRVSACADGASVQAICITASGDPVDMSCEEARNFAGQLFDASQSAEQNG